MLKPFGQDVIFPNADRCWRWTDTILEEESYTASGVMLLIASSPQNIVAGGRQMTRFPCFCSPMQIYMTAEPVLY